MMCLRRRCPGGEHQEMRQPEASRARTCSRPGSRAVRSSRASERPARGDVVEARVDVAVVDHLQAGAAEHASRVARACTTAREVRAGCASARQPVHERDVAEVRSACRGRCRASRRGRGGWARRSRRRPRGEHARDLAHRRAVVGHVLDHLVQHDHIEAPSRERQRLAAAASSPSVPRSRASTSRGRSMSQP